MIDPREVLIKDLYINSCRIIHTDSPVVLLCGGPVKLKERADDPEPQIKSLRHALTLKYPKFELFRPEEITTWQEDAVFKNLVDFETELAAICSLVVVILESAGSIAELGAFSQLSELREKIVVIKSSDFNQEKHQISFINLGILRHLREKNPKSVKTFPWDILNPDKIEQTIIDDVISGIEDNLKEIKQSQKINRKHESHSTTFVCELIRLFIALKQSEIFAFVKKFGFSISKEQLSRKLFLLEKFHLIKPVEYDGAKYYCRTESAYNKVRLASNKDKRIEDVQIILDCGAYYQDIKDRHRLGAIRDFRMRQGHESK